MPLVAKTKVMYWSGSLVQNMPLISTLEVTSLSTIYCKLVPVNHDYLPKSYYNLKISFDKRLTNSKKEDPTKKYISVKLTVCTTL